MIENAIDWKQVVPSDFGRLLSLCEQQRFQEVSLV